MKAILGGSNRRETWQEEFKSLDCNARVYLDCAERLIAEVAQSNSQHARLSVLLDRYATMLHQGRFLEGQERDVYSPFAPYRSTSSIHRNAYTDDPMEYDEQSHTIGFKCLHSAFHPPAPPDKCSIVIARKQS
jgi:hypothetical protein